MLTSTQRSALDAKAPNDNLLGQELHKCKNVVKFVYDFSVDGGAVGSFNVRDEWGNPFTFPVGAIITRAFLDVITACTTSASGTLAFKINSSGDILAATAAASVTGLMDGVPVNTAATAIKVATSAKPVVASIATGALTAGKLYLFVEYYLSAAS